MIHFGPAFNVNALSKLPTIKCAEEIFKSTTDEHFLKADLIALVSEVKGMSKASVTGTCFGDDMTPPPHKIMGKPFFKKEWVTCKTSTGKIRFVRIGTSKDKNRSIKTYDTVAKQEARKNGAEKYLRKLRGKNPKILTLAGECGYDVKSYLKIKPGAEIHNVENNYNVYQKIIKKRLRLINYFGELGKYIEECPNKMFGLINYDTHGYIGKGVLETLEIINRKKAGKYVCLTIQHHKAFRNHGSVANYLRDKYGHYEDPVLECLKQESMQNYIIVDDFTYQREQAKGCTMRTLVFKLIC